MNSEPPSSIDRLDHEQHTNDAIDLLPRLQTGLDVNVKFSEVSAFEYTNTCVIFDQLNISLYHGWLTDPQEMNVAAAVGTLSYNQLVEKIITDKTSDDDEKVRIMILKNASPLPRSMQRNLTLHNSYVNMGWISIDTLGWMEFDGYHFVF